MYDIPLVSAIVTTQNRKELLKRALNSVKKQTYPNIELIVIDDASDESVKEIIDPYTAHMKVILHRNKVSQGACISRNKGIELASGKFVAGLDDDDEWTDQRIEKLVGSYSEEFAFVTSDVLHVYENAKLVWKKKAVITFDALLFSNQVGNQGLIERDRLLAVGGFDESLKAAQDYDLWVRLCKTYGNIKNVQETLQKVYLSHGGAQITNSKNQLKGYLQFYKKHKQLMSRKQRKYQLFNIRKVTGKVQGITDILGWVPKEFLLKELKVFLLRRLL
ncbi:MAG: glycosyltransferase [Gracilimonas sp.]